MRRSASDCTSRPILTPNPQFSFIVEDSGTTTIAFTKTGAHSEALILVVRDRPQRIVSDTFAE